MTVKGLKISKLGKNVVAKKIAEDNVIYSAFEKLTIASANELDILKPKLLLAIGQIRETKKHPDTDSLFKFIARKGASDISKKIIIGELNRSYIGPAICNRIPEILKKTENFNTFKHKIKSLL